MAKDRIQIRLSPDVAAILQENGRCEYIGAPPDGTVCRNCDRPYSDWRHDSRKPTRTEIIEGAVRLWAATPEYRRGARSLTEAECVSHLPMLNGDEQFQGDSANSLSPEATAARAEKKAARATRKGKLQAGVKAALPKRQLTNAGTDGIAIAVKPCPTHSPKFCEQTCKYRELYDEGAK